MLLTTQGSFLVITTKLTLLWNICLAEEDWSPLTADVAENVRAMKNAGLSWLKSQTNKDFGWDGGDTATAIIALAVAQDGWPQENDLRSRLSAKRLEIELLEKLVRQDVEPVTPGIISVYALALNGVCKDPRNFYGNNLIASLEKHHSDEDYPGHPPGYGYSFTSLVSCLGGSHSRKHQVRHLLEITSDESSSVVTKSTALLALECFRRKRHNPALADKMKEAVEKLAHLQQLDGTFGNIQKTSMVVQALAVSSETTGVSWNRTAAVIAMARYQQPDGSYIESIPATSDALLAFTSLLDGTGLLSLKRGECTDFRQITTTTMTVKAGGETKDEVTVLPTTSTMVLSTGSQNTFTDRSGSATENTVTVITPDFSTAVTTEKNSALTSTIGSVTKPSVFPTDISTPQPGSSSSSSQPYTQASPVPPSSMIQIKFWLWIGADPVKAEKQNITVQVPVNSTFYSVMRKAAEENPQYQFAATVWPNGHYVHTLSGRREQPEAYHYWLLYKIPKDPNPESPPPTTYVTPAGVDNLIVNDDDIYLYWYKKI